MTAMAIAPFPNSSMTAQQDSALFASIGTTIVQFAQTNSGRDGSQFLACLTRPPELPEAAIGALQRLMHLLQQLRSTKQQSAGKCPLILEELVPYGMEEALDVLDALPTASRKPISPSQLSALIRLDSLVSPILWAIARSAYPVMELLEGMRSCGCFPEQPSIPGVLRLVPLLEVSTSHQSWRFDLTTGRVPQNLIDPNLQIQSEKALFLALPMSQEFHSASSHAANQQLQGLLHFLSVCNPALQALFQGMPVDLLLPKSSWRPGKLKLSLDFEFVAQEITDFVPAFQPFQGHCIEAELLEGQHSRKARTLGVEDDFTTAPLTVIEIPASLLEPTTLIRIAEQPTLDRLTQEAHRQATATAIAHINPLIQTANSIDPVLTVIRIADALNHSIVQSAQQNFSLLQPELLMDELVPKLLWQLSRCSCVLMQWIGGLPVELLQPDRAWERGILRLMAVLALSTRDRTWHIDLATGRFIPSHSWQFNSDAVVITSGHAPTNSGIPVQQFSPIRVGTLLEQLLWPMLTSTSMAMLRDAIAVEWLTPEQEWQPGQLALHWGFTWMPDVG